MGTALEAIEKGNAESQRTGAGKRWSRYRKSGNRKLEIKEETTGLRDYGTTGPEAGGQGSGRFCEDMRDCLVAERGKGCSGR